ncbi:hypothetical protein EI94DRAFT_1794173 [Lactarius quietus]|nr:hypothetical protein EI94DRAFT_1794173 [Lactarius quietus]
MFRGSLWNNPLSTLIASPLLLWFLTTQYDSLGGFTVTEVAGFSPHADTSELSFSPEEALRALQASVDCLLAALTVEVKELKTQVSAFKAPAKGADSSKPTLQKPSAPPCAQVKPAASIPPFHPSFAKVVQAPAQLSLVIKQTTTFTQDGDLIIVVKHSPQEIVSFLNAALAPFPHQVTLSAAHWTKASLVVMAGPDTMAHHLNATSNFISTSLCPSSQLTWPPPFLSPQGRMFAGPTSLSMASQSQFQIPVETMSLMSATMHSRWTTQSTIPYA